MIALRTQLLSEAPGMVHAAPGSAAAVAQAVDVKGVRMEDLIEALSRAKSSITAETLTWAQEFIRTYGTRG